MNVCARAQIKDTNLIRTRKQLRFFFSCFGKPAKNDTGVAINDILSNVQPKSFDFFRNMNGCFGSVYCHRGQNFFHAGYFTQKSPESRA